MLVCWDAPSKDKIVSYILFKTLKREEKVTERILEESKVIYVMAKRPKDRKKENKTECWIQV